MLSSSFVSFHVKTGKFNTCQSRDWVQSNMSGLSGPSGLPKPFQYPPSFGTGNQPLGLVPNAVPWVAASPVSDDDSTQRGHRGKRSKRTKKHRSKSHKKHRKHYVASYALQLIGFICLILAAVKAFEPLAGVGLTLVLVGYDRKRAVASKSILI